MSGRSVLSPRLFMVLAALIVPQAAFAANPAATTGPLQKLWQKYPLNPAVTSSRRAPPQRPATTPRRQKTVTPRPAVNPRPTGGSGDRWLWKIIGAAVIVFAGAGIAALAMRQLRYRGGAMNRFRLSGGSGRSDEYGRPDQEEPPPEETSDTGGRVARYVDTVPSSTDAGEGIDRISTHVSSIVRAADEAALQIKADAQQEADRLLDQAQREASAQAEAALQRAATTMAEADTVRAEAEEWSRVTRESAEKYAADRRAEAEAEAQKILATADREVAAAAAAAERRQKALKIDISLAEERLGRLASGLHELAARLDQLLVTPARDPFGAEDAEALIEALAPERERGEAPIA
jgi:vacuolar-type H+-ATPase subunit H